MTNLTKKAKIALAGGGAGLLALAVALGVWQPWDMEPPADPADPQQQVGEVLPPADSGGEEGLSLTVGGKKIPCVLHEGDGWSIYVPADWTVEAGENGGIFSAPGDTARLEVIRGASGPWEGAFVSAYPQHLSAVETWLTRHFYVGGAGSSWEVVCAAPEEAWDGHQRLLTALARTLTVGEDKPFSGLSPVASQPDWQLHQGETLLWMDKDANVVDDVVEEHIVTEMMAWDAETRRSYTGQYRLEDIVWSGSYTCLTDEGYVDVFTVPFAYKVAEDMEESVVPRDGMVLGEGWLVDAGRLRVALLHDGSAVERVIFLRTDAAASGQPGFAAELMAAGLAG